MAHRWSCACVPRSTSRAAALQFTVEQARLAGVGRLYEAFLRLKAKLDAEGLFADELKRELPAFPR